MNKNYINDIYLKKKRYFKPKDNFKKLIQLLKSDKPKKNAKLIDIGCANGELLFNIQKVFKNFELCGVDVDDTLLNKAKEICPKEIIFKKKDITKEINLGKFDYVICCGVLSIFRNGKKVLANLKKLLKPNGKIFIFDSLNNYSYNLHIKATNSQDPKFLLFKNMYSVKFIQNFYKDKKNKVYPFFLKKNLTKNKKNYIYNWTELINAKRIVTSGLGLIQTQFWIKIY
jgi:2-polyprenyl-3-methyl-5-hydroxy-6-metoxy-1,4-benzoquinol methylase